MSEQERETVEVKGQRASNGCMDSRSQEDETPAGKLYLKHN